MYYEATESSLLFPSFTIKSIAQILKLHQFPQTVAPFKIERIIKSIAKTFHFNHLRIGMHILVLAIVYISQILTRQYRLECEPLPGLQSRFQYLKLVFGISCQKTLIIKFKIQISKFKV